MQHAVALFRECWGIKRPQVKALKQRAAVLGYHYAQLYFIDGNWWLALAMSACSDAVLGLSARVNAQQECWILANHAQGPLLIVWRRGRLVRICQQSLEACAQEFERDADTSKPIQCLQHGWLVELPAPWTTAAEVNYCNQQRLRPLEQLKQLPVYQKLRRRWQVLMLASAVVLVLLLLGVWQALHTTAVGVTTAAGEKPFNARRWVYSPAQRLPLHVLTTHIADIAASPWQGVWQLKRIELRGQQLVAQYQGESPLALYSHGQPPLLLTRYPPTQRLVRQQSTPLTGKRVITSTTLPALAASQLLQDLAIENRPRLTMTRQARQWSFSWQQWSFAQFLELTERLASLPLHVSALTLNDTPLGWNGRLTLINPTKESL